MITLAYIHLAALVVALGLTNAGADDATKTATIAALILSGVALAIAVIA